MSLTKNVIIAGMPRAGTSLMVRLVAEFGYKIMGRKFPKDAQKKFNPNGYWELNLDEYDTVGATLATQKGRVVKMFGNNIDTLLPESIDKVIVCTRGRVACIASCMKMFKAHRETVVANGGDAKFNGTLKEVEDIIDRNIRMISDWCHINKKTMHEVKLEQLKENPYSTIKEILEYLNKDEIMSAVNLIKKV